MDLRQFDHQPRAIFLARLSLLFLLAWVLLKTAWVCDDAFITFTCSANLVEGKGLVFQPYERVQAFSNPLWTLVMAAARSLTGEVWLTSMVLGIGLSLGYAWLLLKGVKSVSKLILGGLLLVFSSSFVDFSTSGLENALSHLILLLFGLHLLKENRNRTWLRKLFLLGSLAMLNRPDLAFVVGPALAGAFWIEEDKRGRWKMAFLGSLPLLVWELFSLTYYGVLLPNTWYAKLGTGASRSFLLEKGWIYLLDTLFHDPVTILVILLGIVAGLWIGKREIKWIALGALLYSLAVLAAGGDFMRGRMFTVPFALSIFLLLFIPYPSKWWLRSACTFLLVLGFFQQNAPLFSGADYHLGRSEAPWELYPDNITDERAMYWQKTGWFANHGLDEHPMTTLEQEAGANRRLVPGPPVEVRKVGAIGIAGYKAEPGVHLLDELGLGDPLLARLPAIETAWWRAGHRPRLVPKGYAGWLANGMTNWEDPALAKYNEELALLTRGDLWTGKRWAAIVRFLFGKPSSDINHRRYRLAYVTVPGKPMEGDFSPPITATSQGWQPIRILWETVQNPTAIYFNSAHLRKVQLECYRNAELLSVQTVMAMDTLQAPYTFGVGLENLVKSKGLDELLIRASGMEHAIGVDALTLSKTSPQGY